MTSLTRLQPSHRRSRLAVAGCMWHVGLRMRRERARRRQTGGGPKVKTPVFERAFARGIHPPSSLPPPTTNTNGVKGERGQEREEEGREGRRLLFCHSSLTRDIFSAFLCVIWTRTAESKEKEERREGHGRPQKRRESGRARAGPRDSA